jgi:hypothetical protein
MSKQFCCEYCTYKSDRLYNLERHVALKHNQSQNDTSQKVNVESKNVTMSPKNVTITSKNVTMSPKNVTMSSKNVTIVDDQESSVYQCPTCYKSFKQPWYLKKHEVLCTGETSANQCGKCQKIFSCRQHKYRHIKTCNGPSMELLAPSDNDVGSSMVIHNQQNNNNSHVNNGTVNNNITINIRNYGDEIKEHITTDFLDARLQEFNGKGILNLIKHIHFNPDIPENHNIRKHDKQLMKVYEDGDWILRSFKSAIIDLIRRYKDELCVRMMDDDFEKKVKCEVTLHMIIANFMKFDMDKTPSHFYKCVRDIVALVENLELQYNQHNQSTLSAIQR